LLIFGSPLSENEGWMPAETLPRKGSGGHDEKNSPNAQVIEYLTDIITKAIFRIYRLSVQSHVSCHIVVSPVERVISKVVFQKPQEM
jgi:hypothetical protein